MIGEHSILDLLLQASFVVQLVMLLLVGASVASWAIIFSKRKLLNDARRAADDFEGQFWSGGDLAALYKSLEGGAQTGMGDIFVSGFREFSRLRSQLGLAGVQLLDASRRAMKIAQLKETDRLEQSLSTLATIGSTSPYVGLFGTVWGILTAFQALGNVQQATLATVAPAIAEALIATAMGLFAAIPAVIAYNRYADQVSRLELRYDTFTEELSAILQRHAGGTPG
ncbi:MAG: protein TolQ [Gammaproteobacteria bacterium]|jgi:biopolymer transport protein TolQ|nr:protein TolQ [Gammaproteobacteria bacterium]MDH5226609.1 protein TolQ [Gammaproteobacteria bacterium]